MRQREGEANRKMAVASGLRSDLVMAQQMLAKAEAEKAQLNMKNEELTQKVNIQLAQVSWGQGTGASAVAGCRLMMKRQSPVSSGV